MSSIIPVPIGQNITEAVQALQRGLLIGFPTETVYGLGADALNETAVAAVFAAKGRPIDHPLIVHISSPEALSDWAIDIPSLAWHLAKAFWPGPLTLVLKKHPRVPLVVTGGQDTIALRMPNHPLCLNLLKAFGGGIVGPSANRYQRVSPTCAKDVSEELGERLAYIVDGGSCSVGIESTIVSCAQDGTIHLCRQGAILPVDLQSVTQTAVTLSRPSQQTDSTAVPRVPGASAVHYAPVKPVFMADHDNIVSALLKSQAHSTDLPITVLSFSEKPGALSTFSALDWQTVPRDSRLYQQQLYARLRAFDKSPAVQLWIESVPTDLDTWLAVADRLQRATAKTALSATQNTLMTVGRFF